LAQAAGKQRCSVHGHHHLLFFKLVTPQPKVKGVQATAEIQVSRTSFHHRCQVIPQIQKIFLVDLAFAVNVAAWGQGY
jgi:hypothetical protein